MTEERIGGDPRPSTKLLQLVALFVMLLTLLKGIAFPHPWATTHLLFNYQHGFIKRALLGGIFHATGIPALKSYAFLFYFSLAILLANLTLLALTFWELHQSRWRALRFAPLLYASSLGVAYLGNTLGYFDHLGLLATLLALRIRDFTRRLLFVTVSFAVVLFVHEATFIMFLPAAVFSLLLDERVIRLDRRRISAVALACGVLTALTYFISNANVSKAEAMRMFREAEQSVSFIVDPKAYEVLFRSGRDNFNIMKSAWKHARHWREVAFSIVTTLPATLALLYLTVRGLRRAGLPRRLEVLAVLASLSPLALHAFGWDIHRWNAMAITTSFLILWAVARHPPAAAEADEPVAIIPFDRGAAALLCVLVINASANIWFINGAQVEPFPFRRHVHYWERVAAGIEEFPARPLAPKKLEKFRTRPPARQRWLQARPPR